MELKTWDGRLELAAGSEITASELGRRDSGWSFQRRILGNPYDMVSVCNK